MIPLIILLSFVLLSRIGYLEHERRRLEKENKLIIANIASAINDLKEGRFDSYNSIEELLSSFEE